MARVSPSSPHRAGATQPRIVWDRSTPRLLLVSLRPEQWTKNLLVFAGVLFGGRLTDRDAVASAVATFLVFCALSGAVYLFNDIADRAADQNHPLKRGRPLAAGRLAVGTV